MANICQFGGGWFLHIVTLISCLGLHEWPSSSVIGPQSNPRTTATPQVDSVFSMLAHRSTHMFVGF